MVARNFSLQELPYSRLLQMPDDEREFLTLDELKPHQLTELGVEPHPNTSSSSTNNAQNLLSGESSTQQVIQSQNNQTNTEMQQNSQNYGHTIYYDLNSQSTGNGYCTNSIYMDGNSMQSSMIDHPTAVLQQSDPCVSSTKQHYHSSSHNSNNHHHHSGSHYESTKKRKYSYTSECSDDQDDDGCNDAKSVKTTDENKKQNHSEIEKRRRDKMNTYISELSAMIPMCHAMSRKLDKLTVLRMTVQHLKQISGAVQSYTEGHYKPSFLTEQELKMLILQAAEGFLFVVGCDRGRILYVSESVAQVLNFSQGDLLGQSWFDILHPKDVSKVKEQLSSSDLSPREKLIDAKTMLPVKTDVPHGGSRLCPGARRSFFCRMKCKAGGGNGSIQIKEEVDSSSTNQTSSSCHRRKSKVSSDKKYVVVQCTGYLKSWAPAKIGLEEHQESSECDADSYNLSCLVALGRIQPNIYQQNLNAQCPNPSLRNIQFISRHAMDGKFLFVDQRATPVLGFLPQELLGTSMYEYYHHNDIPVLAESHKAALQGTQQVTTPIYQLKAKDGSYVRIQSQWKSFRNPWTKEIEYLIAKNNIILSDMGQMETNYQQSTQEQQQQAQTPSQQPQSQNNCQNFEFYSQNPARDMQRMINTHIEASKIGRQIADQVLDYQRRLGDSSSDSSPDPERTLAQMVPVRDPTLASSSLGLDQQLTPLLPSKQINGTLPSYNTMRVAPLLNPDHANDPEVGELMDASVGSAAVQNPTSGGNNEGNDEAAMAVIMSLLEADAGLGGPVDFSGLPWPLP